MALCALSRAIARQYQIPMHFWLGRSLSSATSAEGLQDWPESSRINTERSSPDTLKALKHDFKLYDPVLPIEQQQKIVLECFAALKKMSWCTDHFDSAIVNYREMTVDSARLGERFPALDHLIEQILRPKFFPEGTAMQDPHILHLASDGFIRPHLDNVTSCHQFPRRHPQLSRVLSSNLELVLW